jgi:uncharacterized membrane protein
MRLLLELLDVTLRWLHVIAGIMWVGNSMLFNWLDRNLRTAAVPRDRSFGETWLLHSGAFYYVEKTLALGDVSPRTPHWFKWQSYITWISGFLLLIAVYYATGGALLVNPVSGMTDAQGVGVGVGALLGGWLAYEGIWRSPLKGRPWIASLLCFSLVLLLGYALGRVFTGRAAFLHIGALMGTVMAGNVRFHIMAAQRSFVAAMERGEEVDARLSAAAKLRSIHNNYITFPVIVLMLSSHFPTLYSARWSVAVLAVLLLGGAGIRHILNSRWTFGAWQPALAVTMLATFGALYALTLPPKDLGPAIEPITITFEDAYAVVQKRCTVCHSASPANAAFGAPPVGVAFDTPEQVRAQVARIYVRAIETQTMPPANQTRMTDEERTLLRRWAYAHMRR